MEGLHTARDRDRITSRDTETRSPSSTYCQVPTSGSPRHCRNSGQLRRHGRAFSRLLLCASLRCTALAQAATADVAAATQAATCEAEHRSESGSSLLLHYQVNSVVRVNLTEAGGTNASGPDKPVVAQAALQALTPPLHEPLHRQDQSWFQFIPVLQLEIQGEKAARAGRPAWTRSRGGSRGSVWGFGDDGPEANMTSLTCREDVFAPGRHLCPDDCPFSAPSADTPCHWRCVAAAECGSTDPRAHIVDKENEICGRCGILGCRTCKQHEDYCIDCLPGYRLQDGGCWDTTTIWWRVFFCIAGSLILVAIIWVVDLTLAKNINEEVLERALVFREHVLLRKESTHKPYPLFTWLAQVPSGVDHPVGGPGNMLHFRFQTAALAWAVLTMAGWIGLGTMVGEDLFVLGTYPAEDQQSMCQAVHWGTQVRELLKEGQLVFISVFYGTTVVGSLLFAALQTRAYNQVIANNPGKYKTQSQTAPGLIPPDSYSSEQNENLNMHPGTMKDYAAVFDGFPPEVGDTDLEERISKFLEEATGVKVVGVSVCWSYDGKDDLMKALELDLEDVEEKLNPRSPRKVWHHQDHPRNLRGMLGSVRDGIDAVVGPALGLGTMPQLPWQSTKRREPNAEELVAQLELKLRSVTSTGKVVAVFHNEAQRDQAVATFQQPGAMEFNDFYPIDARKKNHEPENLIWEKVGYDNSSKVGRVIGGIFAIFCLSVVWGVVFYLPYGYFEAYTYALSGTPPGMLNEVSFTVLVVAGNQMVYVLSEYISWQVGFSNTDAQQVLYVIFYTFAILLNAVVDMFIVGYTAYLSMVVRGDRTDEGIPLEDLQGFEEVFRSYPMMKVCGRMLYEYNFLSCFITPYIAEAVFTIALPYRIAVRFIKTRPLDLHDAEEIMTPMKMDLCRYADIIVNMCLATLSFYLASGWIMWNLLGLVIGQTFVLFFDHYRTLRQVKGFFFSTNIIDEAAQALLCVPCGILAACVAFQVHLPPPPGEDDGGRLSVMTVCFWTFIFHTAFHLLALWGVVPRLVQKVKPAATTPYDQAARHYPANWFTTNPIHCLRSKYIYKHEPPCRFFVRGKEFLLERNEEIGLYYDGGIDRKLWGEPPQRRHSISDGMKRLGSRVGNNLEVLRRHSFSAPSPSSSPR